MRKLLLSEAKVFYYSNADILEPEKAAELKAALEAKDLPALQGILESGQKEKRFPILREWLDVFVVAISVAMAFRAYFYEPFNIPTGSMQPTLYGLHSRKMNPGDATLWDAQPFRLFKFLVTGKKFQVYRAPANGRIVLERTNEGFARMFVHTAPSIVMELPTDAFDLSGGRMELPGSQLDYAVDHYSGRVIGPAVSKGDLLWCGEVCSGDFLFVNRFVWNFRRPRRGDVMIFSTTGINRLQQGTHYIKRLAGLPGETVSFDPPKLLINGRSADTLPDATERIKQISSRLKYSPDAPAYAGFCACDGSIELPLKLGPDEYFACGDNSRNSFDSRYWGPVPGDRLRGVAGGVFWPLTSPRWGIVK